MYGPRSTAGVLVPAPVTWAYAVLLTDVEYWNNNDRIPRISNEIPKIPVIFRVSLNFLSICAKIPCYLVYMRFV